MKDFSLNTIGRSATFHSSSAGQGSTYRSSCLPTKIGSDYERILQSTASNSTLQRTGSSSERTERSNCQEKTIVNPGQNEEAMVVDQVSRKGSVLLDSSDIDCKV